jgi:hypothetical protein
MKVLLFLAASISRADEFDEEQTTLLQSLIQKEGCTSPRCQPHEPPTKTNCPLPTDAKVCNMWGDPFITHAFDGGYHTNVDRDAIHKDIETEKAKYIAYDASIKGFEFMESGVFRVATQGSDFEAQTFMCSGPEIPQDVSSWGPGWEDKQVFPSSSINGVAVKMGKDTVQVLRNPQTKGKFEGDIHDVDFWNHISAVPQDELQEFYVNGKKTSWHALGTDGSLEGASGVDVPERARGEFIGSSRNYISQFHSPKRAAANITATPVCVGSADGKFLFEIGAPQSKSKSAQFEQQVTIFATSPDASGVCGDPTVRNEMNWQGMTATEKLKTSLTVAPKDILFTAKQLADLCHVCHMPMHQKGHVSICSGSHLNKFQEGHYDFCDYKGYSHVKATESCKSYKGQWNAVCIVEQCVTHGKAAKLVDMETELEAYLAKQTMHILPHPAP